MVPRDAHARRSWPRSGWRSHGPRHGRNRAPFIARTCTGCGWPARRKGAGDEHRPARLIDTERRHHRGRRHPAARRRDRLRDRCARASPRIAEAGGHDRRADASMRAHGCGTGVRLLEDFQTYEYIRNFLVALCLDASMDSAAADLRRVRGISPRRPCLEVGGFDPDCLVEDYELIHRLQASRRAQNGARLDHPRARRRARRARRRPARSPAFLQPAPPMVRRLPADPVLVPRHGRRSPLRQARPRDAADQGARHAAARSTACSPSRSSPRSWSRGGRRCCCRLAAPYAGKIALDYAFHLWSVRLYRRWVDPATKARLGKALLYALAEPFTFQVLRHFGATLGWVAFLTRHRAWGRQTRSGLVALVSRGAGERGAG